MALDVVTIQNYEVWGNLVKTWATGVNHMSKPAKNGQMPEKPKTLDELKDQCTWFGVGMTIPDRIKQVEIFQVPDEYTLVIRLPGKEMTLRAETEIKTGQGAYPLPNFYKTIFGNVEPTVTNAVALQSERIGDYSVAECI